MRYNEFKLVESVIKEGADGPRIDHAEDLIFWEGSAGAMRAINAIRSMESGGHEEVTLKWDGSPALIFGRDENGEFILTDKSGFTAKGYNGKAKSPEDLEQMLLNRPGASNPDPRKAENYKSFVGNMKDIYDEYEKAVPTNFRGYLKGDLLYYNTPEKLNDRYSFTPNIVTYEVKADSALGMKIGISKTGIVIHRYTDLSGKEVQATKDMIEKAVQGTEVLAVSPVYVQKPANVDNKELAQAEAVVKQNAPKIDELLNIDELRQKKLTDFSKILYTYTNQSVDTGLNNLGIDFKDWIAKSKLSGAKRNNVLEHIGQHPNAFNALWKTVKTIMKVKDDVVRQFDSHDSEVVQKIGKDKGGEGYVMKHDQGDIKLVPREFFSKANRAKQR